MVKGQISGFRVYRQRTQVLIILARAWCSANRRDVLSYSEAERDSVATIALAAAVGLAGGLLAGIVIGEMLGEVDPGRLRRAVQRFRRGGPDAAADPRQLEAAVILALRDHPATGRLTIAARAIDAGLLELTGIAPDDDSRRVAGSVASAAARGAVVVNRILVEGRDVPPGPPSPITGVS